MVLIALLVVAVVCLLLGLVTASTAWLVASLAASVVAALVLARSWRSIMARRSRPSESATVTAAVPPAERAPGSDASVPGVGAAPVEVVDGRPDYHRPGCARLAGLDAETIPFSQALEDGFAPCSECQPPRDPGSAGSDGGAPVAGTRRGEEVWVVDGYPEYHEVGCSQLAGRAGEPIPLSQALADGFESCRVCTPSAALAQGPAPIVGTGEREVWVTDGLPDYHVLGCPQLRGPDAEAVPYAQAVEDGFQPCAVCRPQATVRAPAGPGSNDAAGAVVWVVDGLSDYHLAGCARLRGLAGEPIPRGQAVEDGFAPCPQCRPDDQSSSPASTAAPEPDAPAEGSPEQVWVVAGRPRYHAADCLIIKGQRAATVDLGAARRQGLLPCSLCQRDG